MFKGGTSIIEPLTLVSIFPFSFFNAFIDAAICVEGYRNPSDLNDLSGPHKTEFKSFVA